MAEDTVEKQQRGRGRPFAPGQSGNPLGRPKGARNRLGEQFVADLYSDWQAHGADVIRRVREERPDQYLKVVVSVLPKELHVTERPLEGLSDEELLEFLDILRSMKEHSKPDVAH